MIESEQKLTSLIESPQMQMILRLLESMDDQVRTYERALPPNNLQARLVVATFGDSIRQALAEFKDLEESTAVNQTPSTNQPFSPREQQVLNLAARGLTNKEIAYQLNISDRTVQFHMNSIFNKTDTESRTEASTLALGKGWITIN